MKHHKTVVQRVVVGNDMSQVGPQLRRHVTAVNRGIELVGGDMRRYLLQFRNLAQQMFEIERLQGTCGWIAAHADSSAGVDNQYMAIVRHRLRNFWCKNK